jgi:hypothetical protein
MPSAAAWNQVDPLICSSKPCVAGIGTALECSCQRLGHAPEAPLGTAEGGLGRPSAGPPYHLYSPTFRESVF